MQCEIEMNPVNVNGKMCEIAVRHYNTRNLLIKNRASNTFEENSNLWRDTNEFFAPEVVFWITKKLNERD